MNTTREFFPRRGRGIERTRKSYTRVLIISEVVKISSVCTGTYLSQTSFVCFFGDYWTGSSNTSPEIVLHSVDTNVLAKNHPIRRTIVMKHSYYEDLIPR